VRETTKGLLRYEIELVNYLKYGLDGNPGVSGCGIITANLSKISATSCLIFNTPSFLNYEN